MMTTRPTNEQIEYVVERLRSDSRFEFGTAKNEVPSPTRDRLFDQAEALEAVAAFLEGEAK